MNRRDYLLKQFSNQFPVQISEINLDKPTDYYSREKSSELVAVEEGLVGLITESEIETSDNVEKHQHKEFTVYLIPKNEFALIPKDEPHAFIPIYGNAKMLLFYDKVDNDKINTYQNEEISSMLNSLRI